MRQAGLATICYVWLRIKSRIATAKRLKQVHRNARQFRSANFDVSELTQTVKICLPNVAQGHAHTPAVSTTPPPQIAVCSTDPNVQDSQGAVSSIEVSSRKAGAHRRSSVSPPQEVKSALPSGNAVLPGKPVRSAPSTSSNPVSESQTIAEAVVASPVIPAPSVPHLPGNSDKHNSDPQKQNEMAQVIPLPFSQQPIAQREVSPAEAMQCAQQAGRSPVQDMPCSQQQQQPDQPHQQPHHQSPSIGCMQANLSCTEQLDLQALLPDAAAAAVSEGNFCLSLDPIIKGCQLDCTMYQDGV